MKRRISDMLDDFPVESIELIYEHPLSCHRVKEITMKKISKKKANRRALSKALLVAAVMVVLTMSVLAAEQLSAGGWFRDVLKGRGIDDSELGKMVEFIDATGEVYQQSITSEGTTVTPIAGYGDENVFYLRLRMTGPEGSVIPEDSHYTFFSSWEQERMMLDYSDKLSYWIQPIPDSNSKDNQMDFLVSIMVIPGADIKLNSGNSIIFRIFGLFEEVPQPDGINTFRQILPGEFSLDLALYNRVEMTELDVKGLSYHKDEVGTQIEVNGEETQIPYDYTITLSSMKISPLSICWTCEYEMSDPSWKIGFDYQMVLKDGSVVPVSRWRGSGYEESHHFAAERNVAIFESPVELADVDYILIGGEHKVFLPAK